MAGKKRTDEDRGRFAYEGLERVLHEKARLGIMTSLVTRPEGLLFSELKRLCALTDGNLSRHLEVLREAGLVEVWKGFENRRPQTLCRLSADGRRSAGVTGAPPWTTLVMTFIASKVPPATDTVSGPDTSFDSSICRPIIPVPFHFHESPLVSGFFRNCLVG